MGVVAFCAVTFARIGHVSIAVLIVVGIVLAWDGVSIGALQDDGLRSSGSASPGPATIIEPMFFSTHRMQTHYAIGNHRRSLRLS